MDTIVSTEAGHLPPISSHHLSLSHIKSFLFLTFPQISFHRFFLICCTVLCNAALLPPNSYGSGASVTGQVNIGRFCKGKKGRRKAEVDNVKSRHAFATTDQQALAMCLLCAELG